jgi:hypothetical protein
MHFPETTKHFQQDHRVAKPSVGHVKQQRTLADAGCDDSGFCVATHRLGEWEKSLLCATRKWKEGNVDRDTTCQAAKEMLPQRPRPR